MGTFDELTKTWKGDAPPEPVQEWDAEKGVWKVVGHVEPEPEAKPAKKAKKKAKKK